MGAGDRRRRARSALTADDALADVVMPPIGPMTLVPGGPAGPADFRTPPAPVAPPSAAAADTGYVMSPEERAYMEAERDPLAVPVVTPPARGTVDPAFDAEMAAAARAEADAIPVDVVAGAPPAPSGVVVTPTARGPVDEVADAEMARTAAAAGFGPLISSPEELRASRTPGEALPAESRDAALLRALTGESAPVSREDAFVRALGGTAAPGPAAPGTVAAPATSGGVDPGAALAAALEGPRRSPAAAPGARRMGGGGMAAGEAAAAPDPNELLISALTNRPMDAPSLVPYDFRTETPLARDLRLNAEAGNIETRRAENAAIGYAMERDRIEAEDRARREYETERRTATAAAQRSYRSFADRAASLRIDPDGFYHSRGVGGTIAASIAIGLGGLGSTINGGPNVALQMINEEIDRDITAQQQQIESAFRRADAEGTLYDMARQEYADRGAALEASRALALENVAAQVGESAASLGSVEARHNAEVMAAQLRDQAAAAAAEAERAEYEWQLDIATREARLRRIQAAAAQAEAAAAPVTGAPTYREPTEARLNAANRLIDSGASPERAAEALHLDPALVAGAPRFAETSTGDSAAAVSALSANLDEIEALIPAGPGEDIPGVGMTGWLPGFIISDEGRALREALTNASDLIGRLRSGAAVTEAEAERFLQILNGSGTDEGLRRGVARIRSEVEARTSRTREGRSLGDIEAGALSGLGGRVVED